MSKTLLAYSFLLDTNDFTNRYQFDKFLADFFASRGLLAQRVNCNNGFAYELRAAKDTPILDEKGKVEKKDEELPKNKPATPFKVGGKSFEKPKVIETAFQPKTPAEKLFSMKKQHDAHQRNLMAKLRRGLK